MKNKWLLFQAALKSAIQIKYQLEDNELSAEPLPSVKVRRIVLLYKSAEGGAGVLRRLLDDPNGFADVAQLALQLCHFDPQTGEDKLHAEGIDEACEAACYNCLMSYFNQGELSLARWENHQGCVDGFERGDGKNFTFGLVARRTLETAA